MKQAGVIPLFILTILAAACGNGVSPRPSSAPSDDFSAPATSDMVEVQLDWPEVPSPTRQQELQLNKARSIVEEARRVLGRLDR